MALTAVSKFPCTVYHPCTNRMFMQTNCRTAGRPSTSFFFSNLKHGVQPPQEEKCCVVFTSRRQLWKRTSLLIKKKKMKEEMKRKKEETATKKAFLKSGSAFRVPPSNGERNLRQKPVIREKAKIAF